jgi:ABC-2 type transport system ATP-binding protein
MYAIEIANLEKTYAKGVMRRPVKAVAGISLQVSLGEAFGFVGPNGAGKSSTIKILMGLARPSAGGVRLFGADAADPRSRHRVGYVPENPCLYDYLTPREILQMSLRLHGFKRDSVDDRAESWLTRLGLGDVGDAPIRSFSKGMTQRVAIAQAMCMQPRLLILDEPLSGLDPLGRREVVDLLSEYKKQGGTLFFTSHVLHDVERLADRFGLIQSGTLRSVRSPSELVGNEEVVMIRSKGRLPLDGWREESAGQWVIDSPRSGLWTCLDALREHGHQLIEVRPSLSLEMAFLQALEHPTDKTGKS